MYAALNFFLYKIQSFNVCCKNKINIVQIKLSVTLQSSDDDFEQMVELPSAVAADADADADADLFFRLPVCWSMIMVISGWFDILKARNKT